MVAQQDRGEEREKHVLLQNNPPSARRRFGWQIDIKINSLVGRESPTNKQSLPLTVLMYIQIPAEITPARLIAAVEQSARNNKGTRGSAGPTSTRVSTGHLVHDAGPDSTKSERAVRRRPTVSRDAQLSCDVLRDSQASEKVVSCVSETRC